MAIHTSAITYKRGIPNHYNNFFFVAQTNNTVPQPNHLYLNTFQRYNRIYINNTLYRWPWRI